MNDTKLTPGKWHLWKLSKDSDPQERHIVVDESGEKEITGVISNDDDARAIAEIPAMLEALRLCVINAQCAADYAGTKGVQCADTLTLKNAPNWPGIKEARELLAKLKV